MEKENFLANILDSHKEDSMNVYEQVLIVSKRARQILEHRREGFYAELDKMGIMETNSDQLIKTEGWRDVIAKTYEAKPSPVSCALKELKSGDLLYTYRDEKRSGVASEAI